ncbi:MAG: zinc-ribbon domain-containing protein [Thiobacillaceae bacterium]
MTEAHKQRTTYGYDALNRLTWATLPDGSRVVYAYDEAGNLISVNAGVAQETVVAPQAGAAVCAKCQAPLALDARFCRGCGAPVPQAQGAFCRHCGQPLVAGARFCRSCGKPQQA